MMDFMSPLPPANLLWKNLIVCQHQRRRKFFAYDGLGLPRAAARRSMSTTNITSQPLAAPSTLRRQLPAWLTGAACAAVPVSIAGSQILLAAAALALAARGTADTGGRAGHRAGWLPQSWAWPLAGFIIWTALSLAFSDTPAAGLSQIRKLILLGVIPLAYAAYRSPEQIQWTVRATLFTGAASAAWGLMQFASEYQYLAAQELSFYENYITHQITGFMSHWMTYGGQLMLILLGLATTIFFPPGRGRRERLLASVGFVLAGTALLAAFTRGAWLGALVGLTYLTYSYRKWLVPLVPVAVLIISLAAPDALRKREESIVEPASDSSIQSRLVMARTGLGMIADHPLFGVGPERVAPYFEMYRPHGITLPDAWYGHLHNSFMQFAAERGLPALFFFLWLLLEMLRANYGLLGQPVESVSTRLARTAVAGTLAMGVLGVFEYNFGDSEVLMLFLFFVTLPLAARRLESPADSVAGGVSP
jgi:O-antigen ligase